MVRLWIAQNKVLVAIVLFIILSALVFKIKPSFLFNIDGSIREFGVGYKNKTILPFWLFSILLGILCYVGVLYFVAFPKLMGKFY